MRFSKLETGDDAWILKNTWNNAAYKLDLSSVQWISEKAKREKNHNSTTALKNKGKLDHHLTFLSNIKQENKNYMCFYTSVLKNEPGDKFSGDSRWLLPGTKTSEITRKEGLLDIIWSDAQDRIVTTVLNFKKRNCVNNGVTGQKWINKKEKTS